MPDNQPDRFPCPKCQQKTALVVLERYGVYTYFCTTCEHHWQAGKPKT